MRSSSPPAPRPSTSASRRKKNSAAKASPPAPLATVFSSKARTSPSSAAATPRWKKRCICPTSPSTSPSCTGVTGLSSKGKQGDNKKLDLHGVFIAIGHTPNTKLFEGQLDMANGYIKTKSGTDGDATATSIP